jgi:hypothetical protein
MPAAENVVDCLLSSQMEGLPGAVDVLVMFGTLLSFLHVSDGRVWISLNCLIAESYQCTLSSS